MRVIVALAILAVCLSLGCSRRQRVVYVEPTPLPPPAKANWVTLNVPAAIKRQTSAQVTASTPPPERSAPNKTSSAKAQAQPGRKLPEPKKVTSVKPSPLPPKTAPQNPSTSLPSPMSAEAKLKAAEEKAKASGVHTLTQEDIDGLSYEQIKQLRGY
jgi:hypothetical protein